MDVDGLGGGGGLFLSAGTPRCQCHTWGPCQGLGLLLPMAQPGAGAIRGGGPGPAPPERGDLAPEHRLTPGLRSGLVLCPVTAVGLGILSALVLCLTFLHPIILPNNAVCRSL